MARILSPVMITALQARTLRLALLADLLFPSAPVYVWNGPSPLTWDGDTYLPLGVLGNIGKIEEKSDGTATGASIALSGVPSSMLAIALETKYQGSRVNLYLACFDAAGAMIMDPYQFFGGTMDIMSIQDGTQSGTISMAVESCMIETQRARIRRFNQEDQQIDFPGDNGFKYVDAIQLLQIYWGNPNGPQANFPGTVGITQNKFAA